MFNPEQGETLKQFVQRGTAAGMDAGACYASWRKAKRAADKAAVYGDADMCLAAPTAPWECSNAETGTYRKELIKSGTYTKGNLKFTVDASLISHWARTGNQLLEDGVRVPVTGADHVVNEHGYGFMRAFEADGDSLYGVMDLVDDDPDRLTAVNDISIFSPPTFTAGDGKTYARPITSVAVTPAPVIPGLKPFEKIAASLVEEAAAPVETDMDIAKIREACGLAADVTEDGVLEHLRQMQAANTAIAASLTEANALVEKLTAEAATIAASNATQAPSPQLVTMAADNFRLRLDKLVADAAITPAVADKLKATCGTESAISLSLSRGGADTINSVLDALSSNRPVALREQTGAQSLVELPGVIGAESDPAKAALMKAAGKSR